MEGDLIVFRITASHFLWRMVRRIVGVLVRLGRGEITEDDFASLLKGQTNPALDVAGIVVRGNPLLAHRTDRPDISTGRESQVSVQHAVAAALVHGEAGLAQFTDACVNDPTVRALRGKVEVVRDEQYSTVAAAVEITTGDGRTHKLSQQAARGSDSNPMSDRDLEDKLRDATAGWNPRHDVAPLIEAIWALDDSQDVSRLAALTVPGQ